MSTDTGADSASLNLNLTPEEKRVYGDLFKQADPENLRVVTGDAAVSFFDKTRLDSRVLGEIWQIADKENRGFLTPTGFGVVLRLIGHAQAGREPRADLALKPAPLPRFDGIHTAAAPAASTSPLGSSPIQAQGTGGAVRIPALTPDKVAQYSALFERQPLQGNMLAGDQARQIFDKSGLPNETLGRIWALADTEQRGALVQPEFIIAMHLLTSMKTGALRTLPNVLPAGLYEAATQRASVSGPRQSPNSTGLSAIPRQMSGTAQARTNSPHGRASLLAPQTTGPAAGDWAVTPADKERFDQIYATLDKTKKGYITGDEAVPFFSQSNLSEEALAQIWDLADFNSQGQLTSDGFAVAMYLIRQQRSGRSAALPAALPANLIPPSMRNQARAPAPTSAFDPPPATQPPPPQPSSALDDLFGLDSSAPNPMTAAPAQAPMSTGGSNANDPFAGGSAVLSPSSPIRSAASNSAFKPFVPSSSFGKGLSAQPTGDGPKQAQAEDLLDDHDPESSQRITGETTELANLSNQIGSLSKEMQDVQGKRTVTQNEFNQTSSQKKNFEQRLAQLRTLYEKEAADARALEEQLRKSRADTQRLQGECMALEGEYRDAQAQHRQVAEALQSDQQENADLRERIRVINGEIAQLKPQIEKLKSEARQQKGLVAINKKQLATTENERDKLKAEAEGSVRGGDEGSRQLDSASPAHASSAYIASPTLSTSSANNPFYKRTASADVVGPFPLPTRSVSNKSFDDVFGPSLPPGSSNTPPLPTGVFKQQHTGNSATSVGSYNTANTATSTPNMSHQGTIISEPPAPPESRQISSSFLPFPDHTESLSSSRQVSPPASRAEGSAVSLTPIPYLGDSSPRVPATMGVPTTSEDEDEKGKAASPATPTNIPGSFYPAIMAETAQKASQGETLAVNEPEQFRNTDQAKAKTDFDNAFAAFASSKDSSAAEGSNTQATFDSEFPPISELEREEDSESDSEQGGFDDDFTTASPQQKSGGKKSSRKGRTTAVTDKTDGFAAAKVPIADDQLAEPATSSLEQPRSAATMTNSKAADTQSTAFGNDMFGSAAPAPMASSNPLANDVLSSAAPAPTTLKPLANDIFSSPAPAPTTLKPLVKDIFNPPAPVPAVSAPGPMKPAAKGAFDDLDDDFDGLEDAKEGSADDDFANISRDDFNPVFDSSPPTSQAKSESTAFGNESSFDFVPSQSVASGSGMAGDGPQKGSDNHDWDAIFSGLDKPTTATPPGFNSEKSKSDGKKDKGPLPGTALAEPGEHDDPILKNLTGMGYSRKDAVAALEKYDYNLERAANFLASQS
ncbi:hypothetical protein RJ55_00644 [Drechmeria coniospora]|nr:hypothetical protein RJ55_00644 [Drechmeria coniospora]